MNPNDRQIWLAILAKLVAPTEPVAAARAMQPMLAMLAGYPDEAFTPTSAQHIALTGRILPDGKTAPLTRVPTYGELETALGKWWGSKREMAAVLAQPIARKALPGPEWQGHPPEVLDAVRDVVHAFQAERSFSKPASAPAKAVIKPAHLSPGALLAAYEAQKRAGATGLDVRIAGLRRQMGLDSGAGVGAVLSDPRGVMAGVG